MLASLRSDLYFALRQLRKSPGFAITAVLTLALGIGATTAVYSLVDGVLLRPLPLPRPERLVAIHTQVQQPGQSPFWDGTSFPDYLDWRARNHTLTGIAAVNASSRLVSKPDGSGGEVIGVNRVSANYFDILGVQPFLGRNFAADEDQAGRHIAIVSDYYWERIFGRSPKAVGSVILISDVPYTIIGVMPRGFLDPYAEHVQIWTSFALYLEGSAATGRERHLGIAEVIGRLKNGITFEQATADLSAVQSGLAQSYPEIRYRSAVVLRSKLEDITGDIRPALLMLMASVAAVLLIVCTNVSGLMLSRTVKRRGEMALRSALGASAWRVWRQLLMESLLLGALGGAAGIALAYFLLHLALPFVPEDIPRVGEVGINARVLFFTVAISLACAALSSLFPAWRLSQADPIEALRENSQNATASPGRNRFQNTLVIVQTGLGVILLIASGLLIRGFVNVRHAKTGFNPNQLFCFLLPLTPVHYPDAKKVIFYDQLLPKLAALPGVQSVSAGSPLPLRGSSDSTPVEIDGRPNPANAPLTTLIGVAEPGLFETLQIPLLRGRNFTSADNDVRSPFVAIVNQAFVKRYFPNEDPIGRHIRPDLSDWRNQASDLDPTARQEREIIGVVADSIQDSVTDPPQPSATFPYAQASALMRPRVVMRVVGDPMQYEKQVAAIVSGMDPFLFLLAPNSMTNQVGYASDSQRFETVLVSGFAAMALLLTGLGLYATLTAMVATRTREIGLRMALGAGRHGVAMLVINRAASLLLIGIALGGVGALATSRILASSGWLGPLLFGVSWFEPGTYSVMLVVLGVVSIAACLVPTWRAVRVDPIRVLRDE